MFSINLRGAGLKSPTTVPLADTGVELKDMNGGIFKPSGNNGGSGSGSGKKKQSLNSIVDGLFSAYKPEKLTYEAEDAASIRNKIVAWLRPTYERAMQERGEQTDRYRAELDADALSRGMGSSTYVTDVKSRQLEAEAEDIALLETEYGARLAELVMEAAEKERERAFEVELQNQENMHEAYLLAYRMGLSMYEAGLGSGGSGGKNPVKGTTEENVHAFLAGLTPEQRKAVYAASDAENALYRDEIVATVGEQGYLDLIRQYPFY